MSAPELDEGRILAIDFGTRRLGFAVSDELRVTSRPLETWTRSEAGRDFERIREHVEALEVRVVVVGRPTMLDGTDSPATRGADAFLRELADEVTVPVLAWDEALTSWAADRRMEEDAVPKKRRTAMRDAYAALVLLEDYLEGRKSTS